MNHFLLSQEIVIASRAIGVGGKDKGDVEKDEEGLLLANSPWPKNRLVIEEASWIDRADRWRSSSQNSAGEPTPIQPLRVTEALRSFVTVQLRGVTGRKFCSALIY